MSDQPRASDRGRPCNSASRPPASFAGAVALALFLGAASRAPATTFYVRASGDDAHDGLSPATAFASIRPAARLLRAPGDRLVVGPGVYHEGNIAPFGNGTPDAPIVLSGDATGALTQDPAGPVTILPPNTPKSTTGFIVYGRNDIVIEGFTVSGAADAGIQVRPRRRTGVDSTRIAILNNDVGGSRKGIQITAVGDVTVTGNRLTGNVLMLTSGASAALRPLVHGNIVEQSWLGLRVAGASGGTIADNELRSIGRNVFIVDSDGLLITGNTLHGPARGGRFSGTNLEIAENVIEAGALIRASMGLVLSRNSFGGSLLIKGDSSRGHVTENRFAAVYASGGDQLDFERNDGGSFEAKGLGTIIATDNRFAGPMKMSAASTLEASHNHAVAFVARGGDVLVQNNDFTGRARISAGSATVAGNTAELLSIVRRSVPGMPYGSGDRGGAFLVEGNVLSGLLTVAGAESGVVQDNVVGGMLKTVARRSLYVARNDAHGIACVVSASDSQCVLAQNSSRHSLGAGLVVIGAGSATVENNRSSDSADSGLAARRTKRLTIIGNEFLSNPSGGIAVRLPLAGDCNDDLDVTIDELMTAVGVAVGYRPLRDCDDADVDGDGAVTVDEIVLSVGAALDPADAHTSAFEIRSNRVEDNGRFGIDVLAIGSVLAIGNRVVRNGGIPIAVHGRALPDQIGVIDNVLGLGGAEGLVLEGVSRARVRNNVIFSNHDAGILLRDAPGVSVVNNLVYANGTYGIAVGLGTPQPAADVVLMNNTVFANGRWGIAIGHHGAPSTGTLIRDNILHGNVRGGIAAQLDSLAGLTIGFNMNDDGYGDGVVADATDIAADPWFVAPAGADGVLGGEGFGDDDLHLQATSPAIDAGAATAAELGITGSAIAGVVGDQGIVDLGYHYGADDR